MLTRISHLNQDKDINPHYTEVYMGSGGDGGNGGDGGDGGNGGTIRIRCSDESLRKYVRVSTIGGVGGKGGWWPGRISGRHQWFAWCRWKKWRQWADHIRVKAKCR